jgi:hypothetical protein
MQVIENGRSKCSLRSPDECVYRISYERTGRTVKLLKTTHLSVLLFSLTGALYGSDIHRYLGILQYVPDRRKT